MLALSLSDKFCYFGIFVFVFDFFVFVFNRFLFIRFSFVFIIFSFSLTNSLFSRFSTFSFSLTKITLSLCAYICACRLNSLMYLLTKVLSKWSKLKNSPLSQQFIA